MRKLSSDITEVSAAKDIVNKITHSLDNQTKDLLNNLTILEEANKANKKLEELKRNV